MVPRSIGICIYYFDIYIYARSDGIFSVKRKEPSGACGGLGGVRGSDFFVSEKVNPNRSGNQSVS
jgi:hypothetical protein